MILLRFLSAALGAMVRGLAEASADARARAGRATADADGARAVINNAMYRIMTGQDLARS